MSEHNYYCVPDATAGPSNLVGSTFTTDQFGVVTVTPIEWVDYWDGTYTTYLGIEKTTRGI